MHVIPSRSLLAFALLPFAAVLAVPPAVAQCGSAGAGVNKMDHRSNGVQITGCGVTLRVTALRDDVLRVRGNRNGELSEDASWAVLNGPRTSSVEVTAEKAGFRTKALRVDIDITMRLTVSDLSGHVLQQDD